MKPFQLSIPTRLHFGSSILKEALSKEKKLLCGHVMIVTTGRSIRRLGYVDEVFSAISPFAASVTVYDQISANPKIEEIEQGVSIGASHQVSAIIGLGGGSSIDAAKAIAACIGADLTVEDLLYGVSSPSENTLPILAIPTTAGSGSELSKAAIVTDTRRGIKSGIRGEALFPKVAIVDPLLTLAVPLKTTAETGFDVLAHAVESYISLAATPFSEMLSEYAIRTVGLCLPRLAKDLGDLESREQMSYASAMMGVNLGNTGTLLPHRLQYPVGALTDSSHSAGLAALYPAWIYYGYDYSVQKFNRVGELLGGKPCSTMAEVLHAFQSLLSLMQISYTLSDLGIRDSDIEKLASEVNGAISLDPVSVDKDIFKKIYLKSMG